MSWLPIRRPADRDPVAQFQHDVNQLFDRWLQWGLYGSGVGDLAATPAMDIEEDDGHYYVHVDLPGVQAVDVSVAVENGTLVISGEKQVERKAGAGRTRVTERIAGRFFREVTLPADADGEHATAQLKRGVLTVTVPKNASTSRRQIHIETD
jgi:HSP20 family protein